MAMASTKIFSSLLRPAYVNWSRHCLLGAAKTSLTKSAATSLCRHFGSFPIRQSAKGNQLTLTKSDSSFLTENF